MTTRFYAQVPKELGENLKYRRSLRERAKTDVKFRRGLLKMCEEDTLFFINAFCYVAEPREMDTAKRLAPFITWGPQDEYIRTLEECWGRVDLGVEKERAAGFSWCTTSVAVKHWRFFAFTLIGLVSKDEAAVDNPENPDSLFWKLEFQIGKLPTWMQPRISRKVADHTLRNLDNNSVFSGYAAVGNVASGGRATVFIMDELAKFPRGPDRAAMDSTQHVTNCRIFGSSYFGRAGVFYELMREEGSELRKFVFDWTKNEHRNQGMYKVVNGQAVELNQVNPLTEEQKNSLPNIWARLRKKGFSIEGTTRSPWYDGQCLRPLATPRSIAQEIDRSPSGTEETYMDVALLKELLEGETRTAQEPKYRGMLAFDPETMEPRFIEKADGDLLIWCDLVRDSKGDLWPPQDCDYSVGSDVSFGVGASNSATVVLSAATGEQVAGFASKFITPEQFARFNTALCKWFRGRSGTGAYLGWEANGTNGRNFTATIIKVGYGNVYRRKVKEEWGERTTDKIGWISTTGDKNEILGGVDGGGLLLALADRQVQIRDAACLRECGEYVIKNGKVVHLKSANTANEAEKGEAHGDRVIAAAIATHLWKERWHEKQKPLEVGPIEPPYGSRAWRDLQREQERRGSEEEAFTW